MISTRKFSIDGATKESPYLFYTEGQTPPEDVGGIAGFLEFRRIMLEPKHPDYKMVKEWARFWTPELGSWQTRARVLR